jgi:chitin disaccharide deacetylase
MIMLCHEPTLVKRATRPSIVICADDFGISRQTSGSILKLLSDGAINATTCLVQGEAWPEMAEPLRQLSKENSKVAIGLHLNVTERLPGCTAHSTVVPWPILAVQSTFKRSGPLAAAIFRSFRVQWECFAEALRKPPDFIDGHMHAHLLPPARRALCSFDL